MRLRRGFTLIEALAAMLISSAAVAIGYASFVRAVDTRQRTNRAIIAVVRASALREQLREWLTSAHTPVGSETDRFDVVDTNGDGLGDEVTFVTLRAAPALPGPAEVTLRWLQNDGESLLVGELREVDTGSPLIPALILSKWVGSLAVRVQPDASASWQGHWSSAVALPHAVELRLTTAVPDSLDPSVAIPVLIRLHGTQ